MRVIKEFLRKIFRPTKEEKIARAKKRGNTSEIFKLEGLDNFPESSEEWYYKLIDICAKHNLEFPIPN
jgi:hypothetical protein